MVLGFTTPLVAAWKSLQEWCDVSEAKMGLSKAYFERGLGRPGSALVALDKHIKEEEAPKKELFETRAALMEALGWQFWADEERHSLTARYPPAFQRF